MIRASPPHFLDIKDLEASALRRILVLAADYKSGADRARPLTGQTLAMIFERPSTRTRVSFECAARQLGGDAIVLHGHDMQLGRGETIADTARVLSRYVDAILLRTDDPGKLRALAAHATVPVINGLTASSHPCQVMADVMTFEEERGPLTRQIIAWCGAGNNMARSWTEAAARFGCVLRLACPLALPVPEDAVAWARAQGATIERCTTPEAAVTGARCVITDCWVSMADDPGCDRRALLAPYQVNEALMRRAAPDALFMHCLPAHREEEVTSAVMDGPQSVVFQEAENRLHVQKGILTWLLGARGSA